MGCVNSRPESNELHSNVFQVMNVDDLGNLITPGKLEINETDIILYQHAKQPIKWPLRCLRRYGYDAEIFSFESGRRCSTGPGIYAFKCRRAAHLFNLVQTNIQQVCNIGDDTTSRELPVVSHTNPTVTRATIPSEPNYLDPTPMRNNARMGPRFVSQQNSTVRLGSVGSSSGPISPQGTMGSPSPPPILPPPPPIPSSQSSSLYVNEDVMSSVLMEEEHNNNKSLRRILQNSSVSNNGIIGIESMHKNQEVAINRPPPLPAAAYMNVDISSDTSPLSPTHSLNEIISFKEENNGMAEMDHAYMNINPCHQNESSLSKSRPPPLPPIQQSNADDGVRHCYANLEANEIESLKKRFSGISMPEKSPVTPSTPTGALIREVNYAVLDLDTKESLDSVNASPSSPPESPAKTQKGYATIDFQKTTALSHSVAPNLVNDNEGSRKTRHNSTINDFTSPFGHSSSVSE